MINEFVEGIFFYLLVSYNFNWDVRKIDKNGFKEKFYNLFNFG